MRYRTVALETLGCKLNQYETAGISDQFERKGLRVVPFAEAADVYVINTCTVTDRTDKVGRQLIRRAQRQNPEATIVVTGCYVQYNPREAAAVPGVHLVVGNADKDRIVDLLDQDWDASEGPVVEVHELAKSDPFVSFPMTRFPGYTRGFVKIQDGCDLRCSFCAIRIARGPSRSEQPGRVLEHAERLIEAGFEEIVLTGVHLVDYGRDLMPRTTLATLLEQIVALPGLGRVRLSSLEPLGVTDALVDVLTGSEKICHYLHLALQSGSDAVLRRMRRRYTTKFYSSVVERCLAADPDYCIAADVMVGFPGETEAEHRESLQFVRDVGLSHLHVFSYSRREGTVAASMPDQVPPAVRARRSAEMRALHEELKAGFHARALGRSFEALVLEDRDEASGRQRSLTGHYVEVLVEAVPADVGRLVRVRAEQLDGQHVLGRIEARSHETTAAREAAPLILLG
jgi:threonylcarbamoyladenosine tRNA methylthiotransferase MtaB